MSVTSVKLHNGRTRIKNGAKQGFMLFSLISRLRRTYKSSKIAENMVWHHEHRVKNGVVRHPADAKAWKEFDEKYTHFVGDP